MKKYKSLREEADKPPLFTGYAGFTQTDQIKQAADAKTIPFELERGAAASLEDKQKKIPYVIGIKRADVKMLFMEGEFKIVNNVLFVSPMVKSIISNRAKGRSTSETERKKSSLQQYIESKLSSSIISLLKKYISNKANESINMFALNYPIMKIDDEYITFKNPAWMGKEEKADMENPKKFYESKLRSHIKSLIMELGVSHRIAQIDEAGDIAANEAKMNKISEELSKVAKIDKFLDKINLKHYIGDKLYKQVKKEISNSINEYESAKSLLEKKHQDKTKKQSKSTKTDQKDDQVLETNS